METRPLRPVIVAALAGCLAVAMAPWLSGGQEPLAMVLSGGALLLALLLAWRQSAVRWPRRSLLGWAYAALLSWGGLSLLWTANRYSTALWLMVMGLAGLAFGLSYVVAGERRGRRWLWTVYGVSAAAFGAQAVWLYLSSDYDRLTGLFYWANPAAAYLIPALVLAANGLRTAGRRSWWWAGALALGGGVFALTDSRGAALVLVLVLVALWLVQRLPKGYWIKLVLSLAGAAILTCSATQWHHHFYPNVKTTTPGARFGQVVNGESQSGSDRIRFIESGLVMWFAHPLVGVGAGAYGDVHPQYQQRVVSASANAHNFYVQTLAELGLVGAALLAWAVLALGLGVLRGLVEQTESGWSVAVALGLAGLLVHFGLDIDAQYPALVVLAAVLAGSLYGQWRRVSQSERVPLGWWWPALGAVLLAALASAYQSNVWLQRGQAAQADGQYQMAVDDFARSAAQLVHNPDGLSAEGIDDYTLALGGGASAAAEADQAVSLARQAAAQDPADGQHHQLEGRALALRGDTAGAEAAFHTALRLDPYNHPEYALDLVGLLDQLGRPTEALAAARAMLVQYPDPVIANRANDLTLRPTLANLWSLVGNIELKQGHAPAARQAAARALAIYPDSLRGRALQHQLTK